MNSEPLSLRISIGYANIPDLVYSECATARELWLSKYLDDFQSTSA